MDDNIDEHEIDINYENENIQQLTIIEQCKLFIAFLSIFVIIVSDNCSHNFGGIYASHYLIVYNICNIIISKYFASIFESKFCKINVQEKIYLLWYYLIKIFCIIWFFLGIVIITKSRSCLQTRDGVVIVSLFVIFFESYLVFYKVVKSICSKIKRLLL